MSALIRALITIIVAVFLASGMAWVVYLRVKSSIDRVPEKAQTEAIYDKLGKVVGKHPVIALTILTAPFVVMILLPFLWAPPSGKEPFSDVATARATIGLVVATAVLAGFTFLLAVMAVMGAHYARRQIVTTAHYARRQIDEAMGDVERTMREKSADFTLRLHDEFHSDRALRIRHGAVLFLKEKRRKELDTVPAELDWDCADEHISPFYNQAVFSSGLNSDLVDVLNMLDRMAYLTYVSRVVDVEMAMDRFGNRVAFYYEACKPEIEAMRDKDKNAWRHLYIFYGCYRRWLRKQGISAQEHDQKEINKFVAWEHVRSHRGSAC